MNDILKLLACFFVTVSAMSSCSGSDDDMPAAFHTFTVDEITYRVISPEEMTVKVERVYSRDECITIPETVYYKKRHYTVVAIKSIGPSYTKNIELPSTIETIEAKAFSSCPQLSEITIPDRVTTIGNYAFLSCGNLSSVQIGSSVTSIGDQCFRACISLTEINFPKSVSSIGSNAFLVCESIERVYCNWDEPLEAEKFTFGAKTYKNATLVVPANTKALYSSVEPWKNFSKIVEY